MLLLYDALMVSLAVEDYKYRTIRNNYVKIILLLSLAAMIIMPEITVISRVKGMLMISLPMLILKVLFHGSFGGGDVKLAFASGAFLGQKLVLEGTVTAILLAGVYCLWMIGVKKARRNMQFALGPFLSAGYMIMTFTLF